MRDTAEGFSRFPTLVLPKVRFEGSADESASQPEGSPSGYAFLRMLLVLAALFYLFPGRVNDRLPRTKRTKHARNVIRTPSAATRRLTSRGRG